MHKIYSSYWVYFLVFIYLFLQNITWHRMALYPKEICTQSCQRVLDPIEIRSWSFGMSCTLFVIKTFIQAYGWTLKPNIWRNTGMFSWTWTDRVRCAKWKCYVDLFAITRPATDFYDFLLIVSTFFILVTPSLGTTSWFLCIFHISSYFLPLLGILLSFWLFSFTLSSLLFTSARLSSLLCAFLPFFVTLDVLFLPSFLPLMP